jgi:hypothetical protein
MIKAPVVRIFAGCLLVICLNAFRPAEAQVAVSITIAPPPLPVYEQPEIPAPGYIWTPGYWDYGPDGYFWVPGTWVEPPVFGLLWTPGYWGWSQGIFFWNVGYWAPQIGFYGGVNYGFGYPGHGYEGGYWRDNQFYYNRTVNNITNVQITNVYTRTVVNNVTVNRVSYTGGPGGIPASPTAEEQRVARAQHAPPTPVQLQHHDSAAARRELLASVNQGKPPIAATAKPADFSAHVVTASRAGGPIPAGIAKAPAAPAMHPAPQSGSASAARVAAPSPPSAPPIHARDLPANPAPAQPPQSATAEQRNYANQQAQLHARQYQEREVLAQQQERDHANLSQGNNSQALAAMERQHQQQTQQLQQRHSVEQQQVQRAAPHAPPPPAREPPH